MAILIEASEKAGTGRLYMVVANAGGAGGRQALRDARREVQWGKTKERYAVLFLPELDREKQETFALPALRRKYTEEGITFSYIDDKTAKEKLRQTGEAARENPAPRGGPGGR